MDYHLLGTSGLRVSDVALGTMTFGEDWGWGADRDTCEELFERYVDAGGNFIDTANNYTDGTAERIVGDLVAGDRDRHVIATKYTLNTREGDPNANGNQRKNMFQSVEASLDRLGTDYIDLLWVHAWDGLTPIAETMRGLDDLVSSGRVHYIGFSDAPAWVIARAQTLAEERRLTPLSAIQIQYNPVERTVERELLPMARELELGVTVWGPLGGGVLTGKYEGEREDDEEPRGRVEQTGDGPNQREEGVTFVVRKVAEEVDATPAQVALAWIRQQPGQQIPILGATTPEQLDENLGNLDVVLDQEHLDRIDRIGAIDMGFPWEFLAQPMIQEVLYGGMGDRIYPYHY